MFSIPLRLAVGMLLLVAMPGLVTVIGPWRPPRVGKGGSADAPGQTSRSRAAGSAGSPPAAPPALAPTAPTASRSPGPVLTQHARLMLDGAFARRIGLLAALRELEMPGKSVRHTPQDHLITALVNVLAGHDQLQEISRGGSPLRGDRALAQAWDQEQFPEVSGVCRQLHAVDWPQAQAVRESLDRVFAPYVAACASRALHGDPRLVVDWDLTPKQITTEAQSDRFAAYGHMEDGLGKGYQWAEAVLRSRGPEGLPRAVSLGGFLCPGNVHPDRCQERLRLVTERALGRPRRRPDLLRLRLAEAEAQVQRRQASIGTAQAHVAIAQQRLQTGQIHLHAITARLAARCPEQHALLTRDERARDAAEKSVAARQTRLANLQSRLAGAECLLAETRAQTQALQERLARLEAENADLDQRQQAGIAIEVVCDSQFGSSDLVTSLREEGYEVTTKAISPATITGLLRRERHGESLFGPWKLVSPNAEVAECCETRYAQCPAPLRLVGYRKHLAGSPTRPAQTNSALFLTSIASEERNAEETAHHYHVRGGTVELLNRQAKSHLGFRGHRLRHGPGLDLVGQFVFAGLNFVPWLADTVWAESDAQAGERPSLAELTQMACAPGHVLPDDEGVAVQFAPEGGWPHRTLRLGLLRQPPLPGFVWPGVPLNAQRALQNSNRDLVARKLG